MKAKNIAAWVVWPEKPMVFFSNAFAGLIYSMMAII
jgi:hypothetical protein